MTDNAGGCDTCGETYADWDFGVDRDGYLILNHVCSRIAISRQSAALPRYEHLSRFGLMACERCDKTIQRRRLNQKVCIACSLIVRKEQDFARYHRKVS